MDNEIPVPACLQTHEEAVRQKGLFKLPREIRNDIYKLVLAPIRAAKWAPRGNSFPGHAFPIHRFRVDGLMGSKQAYIGLLQSCRQLHDEVSTLLYNTVEMDLHKDREPEKGLVKLGVRHLKYIKNITIEFRHHGRVDGTPTFNQPHQCTIGAWRAATILLLLRQAGATLYTVTLKAPWHHETCAVTQWHRDCLSLEPLLQDPSIFSNVQSVIFPDYLALCPSRNYFGGTPQRNRPLTQANRDEIVSRLGFQVEVLHPGNSFDRTIAPLAKGFFVIKNPRDALRGVEDMQLPPRESGWIAMVQEYMEDLEMYGISDSMSKPSPNA